MIHRTLIVTSAILSFVIMSCSGEEGISPDGQSLGKGNVGNAVSPVPTATVLLSNDGASDDPEDEIINHPPDILETTMIPEDEPAQICGIVTLCATVQDEESGYFVRFHWDQTGGPALFSGPYPVTHYANPHVPGASYPFTFPVTECVYLEPRVAGTYQITLTAIDWTLMDNEKTLLTTEEWLASQGEPNPISRTSHTFTFNVGSVVNTAATAPVQRFDVRQAGVSLGTASSLSTEGRYLLSAYDYGFVSPNCPNFGGNTFHLSDEPWRPISYNGDICIPDVMPATTPNQAMMFALRAASCDDPFSPCPVAARPAGLVTVLDEAMDGSGGEATLHYSGLGSTAYPILIDDRTDTVDENLPDGEVTATWSWRASDSDGLVLEEAFSTQCTTITPNFSSGIDTWVMVADITSAERPPIDLDTQLPAELCPLRCVDTIEIPGDANGDDLVDGADFLAWQKHAGTPSGADLSDGDFDADDDVDSDDLAVWEENFGSDSPQ